MFLSHILICCVPNPGHFRPMFAVGRHLASIGHTITFNTSDVFRKQVEASGLRFVPLTGKANIDYQNPSDTSVKTIPAGMESTQMLKFWLTDPFPDQYNCVKQILSETPVDLIVTDTGFFGGFPLLLGPRENRPPILSVGVNPLMLRSVDCGVTSPPATTPEERERNRKENLEAETRFQALHDEFDAALNTFGARPLPGFFADLMYTLPDRFLQFTGDAFEYPRSDMPATIHFVGPVWPNAAADFKEPAWWKELDGSRPVAVVTQGTLTNFDLNELIQPTLTALAEDDVFVIAVTGGADTKRVTAPSNARVEKFIPFEWLLPKADVLITNGGYGSVQQALSMGVPLVVAGEGEKGFSAARVAWTGAGIDLKTGHPTAEQIGTAARTVLADQRYREQAQRLQRNFAQYDALAEIARHVDSMLAGTTDEESMTPTAGSVS
jgi:MGT family glycosyltransferase